MHKIWWRPTVQIEQSIGLDSIIENISHLDFEFPVEAEDKLFSLFTLYVYSFLKFFWFSATG